MAFCYANMTMKQWWQALQTDIHKWLQGWYFYLDRHILRLGKQFELRKDTIVDILIARRGSYQWPFLHLTLVVLFVAGVASAPIVANTYPSGAGQLDEYAPPSATLTSLDLAETMQTQRSEKPRDQVIVYPVKAGETLASIAKDHGVSVDTIKWANDLKKDTLSIGQELNIPPVTGVVHKVREGETIYSIAKKYKTEAQNIVNFPFNDFADPETFALSVGQTLVVPDGVMPEAAPVIAKRPQILAGGGTGQLIWPTTGLITQYPSWYHMAIDIANSEAPGIMAADSGVVSLVQYLNWGYGQHIMIDHGNGIQTLYGHLQAIYVKVGDRVAKGQVIGRMGSTGRSTGTHLHFEVRNNGQLVSPLGYLK